MTRGLLRLCKIGGEHMLTINRPPQAFRLLRTSAKYLKDAAAKPAVEPIKGVSYSNLKIGVPKEKWTNERR